MPPTPPPHPQSPLPTSTQPPASPAQTQNDTTAPAPAPAAQTPRSVSGTVKKSIDTATAYTTHYVEYLKAKTRLAKAKPVSEAPVLSESDVAFLRGLSAREAEERGARKGAGEVKGMGESSCEEDRKGSESGECSICKEEARKEAGEAQGAAPKKSRWSRLFTTEKKTRVQSPSGKEQAEPLNVEESSMETKETMVQGDTSAERPTTPSPSQPPAATPLSKHHEEEDLTITLERLNLSTLNNRAFSLDATTQTLLTTFTQILKDLIHGVPTAYHDLESFLTNSDHELQRTYDRLPSFLQTLIRQMPDKLTAKYAPDATRAAAEKAGKRTGRDAGEVTAAARGVAKAAAKFGVSKGDLKRLVTTPAALAGMLKSIVGALKTKFPAVVVGGNVLWSVALFALLCVVWYCYKRGREVRLEREAAEAFGVAAGEATSFAETQEEEQQRRDVPMRAV